MELTKILMLISVGIAAGFINTLAGGGSLITMPMLIFTGLPSAVANGTNRIALMIQNIIAISNFKSKGYFDLRLGIMLAIPAIAGSVVGANIAVSMPDEVFNKLLAFIMIVVLIFILWQPHKKIAHITEKLTRGRKIVASIAFFFVGVYGGMVQAGVGFIIILSLTLITGFSLVKINSIKVFVVALYMVSSIVVFVMSGKVDWMVGLVLGVGNGIGGYIGSNFAVKKGDKWIKIVLSAAVLIMAAKLSGVIKF